MGEKKHKRRDIAESERLAAQMNVVELRAELEKQTGLVRTLTQRLDAIWNALGRPIGDGTIGRMQPMIDRIAELTEAAALAEGRAIDLDQLRVALAATVQVEATESDPSLRAVNWMGPDAVRRFITVKDGAPAAARVAYLVRAALLTGNEPGDVVASGVVPAMTEAQAAEAYGPGAVEG